MEVLEGETDFTVGDTMSMAVLGGLELLSGGETILVEVLEGETEFFMVGDALYVDGSF